MWSTWSGYEARYCELRQLGRSENIYTLEKRLYFGVERYRHSAVKSSAKNFLLCFPEHMASKPPLCFLCLCNCTFIQTICQHHTCSSRVRLATFKSVMLGTLTACFSILRKYASHSSSRCFLNVCIVSFSSLLHSLLTCVINNMVIIMYVYIQTALEP